MKNINRITAAVSIICCAFLTAWGQENVNPLDQLASPEAAVREKACKALIEKGPLMLDVLFERMDTENTTERKWLERTAEKIVYQICRPGADLEKDNAERALLRIIRSGYPRQRTQLACILLSLIGTKTSVPTLELCLAEKNIREPARYALERIEAPEATAALIRALDYANEAAWKAALIKTLGAKGDLKGLPAVLKRFRESNQSVRLTAINAASRLPASQSRSALMKVWNNSQGETQNTAADALLVLAEHWLDKGKQSDAVKIYRPMFYQYNNSLWRYAGLAGLAQSMGEEALPELTASVMSNDQELRGVAMDHLARIPGQKVTRTVVELLPRVDDEDKKLDLVRLQQKRDDPAVSEALPVLMQIVTQSSGELRTAAASALTNLPEDHVNQEIRKAIISSSFAVQATLIRVLGDRGDQRAVNLIISKAKSGDTDVQIAALEVLGMFEPPSAVPVLRTAMKNNNPQIRNTAAAAAAQVAESLQKAGQKQKAINLCVEAARSASDLTTIRHLVERLRSLGAAEYVAEMAQRSGFVVNWWALGPLPNRETLLQEDYIDTSQPVNITKPIEVEGKEYRWKHVILEDPSGQLNLERIVARQNNVGAYLYAEIHSTDEQEAVFKIGSDDDVFCWLNGELVHKFEGSRGWRPDQDVVNVQLKQGTNWILMKVLNGGAQWAASLRITDQHGTPLMLQPQVNP